MIVITLHPLNMNTTNMMTVNVCSCSTALMTVRRNDPSIMRLYKALRLHEALLKIEPHQAVFKMLILPWICTRIFLDLQLLRQSLL